MKRCCRIVDFGWGTVVKNCAKQIVPHTSEFLKESKSRAGRTDKSDDQVFC